jgi:hypothetical protein
MISFIILGSSKLQSWALEHSNNGGVNDNLLSSMLSDFDFDSYSCFLIDENREKSVTVTSEV